MLSKENRLKKKSDFDFVFSKGRGFGGDFLFLKTAKNNLKISRFGFVVSKKVSNKAVIRNKIKRRMSEVVRSNLIKIKEGMDVVIIANKAIKEEDFSTIKEREESLFQRSGLIKK